MNLKTQYRGLHTPKLTPITKQQYRKFTLVRKLQSNPLGPHSLLSHNQKKYIQKSLPIPQSFLTLRPQSQQIYHYTDNNTNIYIFQLQGEPLANLLRGHHGLEIKDWVERCGGLDCALLDLMKMCLRMYLENGVGDFVGECFRVWEGRVWYNWDTWMAGSLEIVRENSLDIENYFLSQLELAHLAQNKQSSSITLTHKECLFKIGLLILALALPEIKIRTYEYCQYQLNHANLSEKLNLFHIKMPNKQLTSLVTKFLNYEIETVDQIWKIVEAGKNRGESPSGWSQSQEGSANKSALKVWQKENVVQGETGNFGHGRNYSNVGKTGNLLFSKGSSNKKVRLRGKSGSINESINLSTTVINIDDQKNPKKKSFNLKQPFSKIPTDFCLKVLEYLGLTEHISETLYQKSIIKSLQNLRMKTNWTHKSYSNGSIYVGDMLDEKREGKGIYLFDSEDLYAGDWRDNGIHGFGTYVFKSGEMYEGELRKGLKHGFGKFFYKDGRIYQGHWEDNNKCGFGNVTFPNGMKFFGFFNKGNETYGLFTKINDEQVTQFQGNLQNYNWQTNTFNNSQLPFQSIKSKLKHSKNESSIPCIKDEGSKYFGDSELSQPNGFGIRQTQFQIYEGQWKKGRQDGHGKLVVKNKFQVEGQWRDGIMTQYKLK